jgi:hypothetical protein
VPTIVFHGDRDHGMATKVREMLRFGVQAKNDLALRVRNCDKAMNLGDRGALESPIQSLDPMHTAARTRANLLLRQPSFPIRARAKSGAPRIPGAAEEQARRQAADEAFALTPLRVLHSIT